MTFDEFAEIFAPLALQLRAGDADEPTARAYFRVLGDVDASLVQLAANQLARTAQWFPKSSEWLDTARSIERERQGALSERLRLLHRRGVELCYACGDTGWVRDELTDAVRRCECQSLRRLEILGRRPLPALPS